MALRQTPLACSGHTRPVVDLDFSEITQHGYFLISACKGMVFVSLTSLNTQRIVPVWYFFIFFLSLFYFLLIMANGYIPIICS